MQLHLTRPQQNFSPIVVPDNVPVYRVGKGKFFIDNHLREEGTILSLPEDEEPNLSLEPLNNLARIQMAKFIDKLNECGKAVAAKTGRAYVSLANAFSNAHALARQDSNKAQILNAPAPVPLMGGRPVGPPKAKKLNLTAEMGRQVVEVSTMQALDMMNSGITSVGKKADGTEKV